MFMNTGIIPLLVNAEKDRWFVSGGLVVDIFFIQLANIFVAPLIYLISPMYRIR